MPDARTRRAIGDRRASRSRARSNDRRMRGVQEPGPGGKGLMGKNSLIEWCRHTFNAWRGCAKVSDGCTYCYAWRGSKRNPKVLGVWGLDGTRIVAAESGWRELRHWNAEAKAAGERHRVFCSS